MQHDSHAQEGRVGIIDIGSNSIRLVVYDQLKRAPIPLYNEKVMCALGRGLAITGLLNPEGVELGKSAIARFLTMARNMEVTELSIIATAAVRDAKDGPAFVEYLEQKHDIHIEVITGKREARLGAHGICASIHEPDGIAADLGGASMELVRVKCHRITDQVTLPIGPLRLIDQTDGKPEKMRAMIEKQLETVDWLKGAKPNVFYAIGGSFRALGTMHLESEKYPLNILHEYNVPGKDFLKFAREIAGMSHEKMAQVPGVASKRIPALTPAAMVLEQVLELTKPEAISFSASGIREGYLYEKLAPHLREQDVLLAACADMAHRIGKQSAYGHELFLWMYPLFKKENEAERRLRLASCLVGEVSLHIHPEYRAPYAFERIVQSSLTGLSHRERITLALACYHRYQLKLKENWPALSLVSEKEKRWARLVGSAANLAYHLTGGIPGNLHKTSLVLEKNQIALTLSGNMHDIMGDAVKKRLEALKDLLID